MTAHMLEARNGFVREFNILPAVAGDRSAILEFILRGVEGCVTTHVYTGWGRPKEISTRPIGGDLTYHSIKRLSSAATKVDDCEYLGGAPCYCDSSGGGGISILHTLIKDGMDAVWQRLEQFYMHNLRKDCQ